MRKYLIFAVICLAFIMVGTNSTSVVVAFPSIASSFEASLVQAGLALSAYQIVFTAILPVAARASDIFGRKPIFLSALLVFTAGSALCAVSPNIELLILFRSVQAIGAAGISPVATAMIAETFPSKRQQFIGLISSVYPIGQIIGPILGAWLIVAFGWRSVFWLGLPFGVGSMFLAALVLRPSAREKGSLDLIGALLLGLSLLAVLSGLSLLGNGNGESQIRWLASGLLVATGAILMLLLALHLRQARDGIVAWTVLKGRPFLAANIYNFLFGVCFFGVLSFAPFYAVSVYSASTLESGLVLTPWSLGIMASSAAASMLLVRSGYRMPMILGTAILFGSLFLLSAGSLGIGAEAKPGNIGLLMAIMCLSGIGMGMIMPASNNACMELMPNRIASISGVRIIMRSCGGAMGIALVSILLNNTMNLSASFGIAFLGLGVVTLISLPFIFIMPGSPMDSPLGTHGEQA